MWNPGGMRLHARYKRDTRDLRFETEARHKVRRLTLSVLKDLKSFQTITALVLN